jgi:signal transduction histidine kinase
LKRRGRTSRTAQAALLALGGLAAVLIGWITTGWRSAQAQAQAVRDAPRERAARAAAELAGEFGRRLDSLRVAEDKRPYYHYQSLFHDPRGAATGLSVVPSPLAERSGDPLIDAHFQIDADGRLTIPTVNEEVPELGDPAALPRQRELLADLRRALPELALAPPATGAAIARQDVAPPPQELQQQQAIPPQVQRVAPEVYAQNRFSNSIYLGLRKQPTSAPGPTSAPEPPESEKEKRASRKEVEVRTEPLAWRTAKIAGKPSLVALRQVATPDGGYIQGFTIAAAAAASWLADRSGDLVAHLARIESAPFEATASAQVPGVSGDWRVAIDATSALAAADQRAEEIEMNFWRTFVPIAFLGALCAGLMVWIVARTEHLARERSRFAAAAAHELRTPLAGLQLYGDMLADGLGDRGHAQLYARRIADEAARLGRVVGNVLGFTQLERGTLGVSPRPGDAAEVTRRIVEAMRPALEDAGVLIESQVPEQAPARFDEDALARILQNLLDNAEKYTRGREPRTVWVVLRAPAAGARGALEIEVADDGPGVPKRLEGRLFQPFERGGEEGGPAGLGLGLALARALARAQGGDLEHRARAHGCAFALQLPVT